MAGRENFVNPDAQAPAPAEAGGFAYLLECGDPVMAEIVRRIGPLDVEARRRGRPADGYGALVRSIVGQQLSTKAARTIYNRLCALFDDQPPTPRDLISTDEDALRAAGLSRRKTAYLLDLARRVESGDPDLYSLHALPDEEVIPRLTAVKGLGRWTAEVFLIFHLGRPDVLPVGDAGIRRAVKLAYKLDAPPDSDTLEKIAEPWRPRRTLACLYLWESLDGGRQPIS